MWAALSHLISATANAVQDGYFLRFAPIFQCDLTEGGTTGIDHPFQFHTGNDILQLTIPVLRCALRIKIFKAGCQDYGPDFDFDMLFRLLEVNCFGHAELFASAALSGLEVGTVERIDNRDARNCLWERSNRSPHAFPARDRTRKVSSSMGIFRCRSRIRCKDLR